MKQGNDQRRQELAVRREAFEAVADQNFTLAWNIMKVNPDLFTPWEMSLAITYKERL